MGDQKKFWKFVLGERSCGVAIVTLLLHLTLLNCGLDILQDSHNAEYVIKTYQWRSSGSKHSTTRNSEALTEFTDAFDFLSEVYLHTAITIYYIYMWDVSFEYLLNMLHKFCFV